MTAKNKEKIYTLANGQVKMIDAGYKPTTDARVLADAVNVRGAKTILDVGVGTGGVVLPILARAMKLRATGIDVDTAALEICAKNAALNSYELELVQADITKWKTARQFDVVVSNPPYWGGAGRAQHHGADLGDWVAACVRRVAPRGRFYMIVDAARLADAMRAIPAAVGGITLQPVFSNKDWAERVIISGRLGTKEPSKILKAVGV